MDMYITATPFDFMRWKKAGFYTLLEERWREKGQNLSIEEVSLEALEISAEDNKQSNGEVTYLVTLVKWEFLDPAA